MTKIGEIVLAFATKFFNVFKLGMATIVGRVLATFGLSLVSFNGILPNLKAFVAGYVNQLPPQALEMASALGFDVFCTMILSALSVRFAWKVMLVPKSVADSLGGHP